MDSISITDERQPLVLQVPQLPQPPKTNPPNSSQNQQFQHHQLSSPFQPPQNMKFDVNSHFMVPVALENSSAIIQPQSAKCNCDVINCPMLGIVQCLDCGNLVCDFHSIPKQTNINGKQEFVSSNYYCPDCLEARNLMTRLSFKDAVISENCQVWLLGGLSFGISLGVILCMLQMYSFINMFTSAAIHCCMLLAALCSLVYWEFKRKSEKLKNFRFKMRAGNGQRSEIFKEKSKNCWRERM